MTLYQYTFDHQPHYIVAMSMGDAEQAILEAGYTRPEKMVSLGPYILVTNRAIRILRGYDED